MQIQINFKTPTMKFKLHLILLLSFCFQFLSFDASAKFVDATISFLDGKEINCLIDLPIKATQKKVSLKKDKKSSVKYEDCDNIDFILLNSNDQTVLLKRTKVFTIKLKSTKLSKNKAWYRVDAYCENIISYVGIGGYDVNRNGDLVGIAYGGMGEVCLQRTGEKNPTEVGFVFAGSPITQKNIDKDRHRKLVRYYQIDPEALKYFESMKRVSEDDLIKFVERNCEEIKD